MSKKIFISHAVKDKEIAAAFVDFILHGALSVPIDEIFCVSTDGTKIKSGDDWRDSIKSNILSAKINFLLISPNYKESEVCMNEMGAAWMTEAIVLPLIIDPINYKTVGVIQELSQIEKLIDETSLDRIRDIVQEELDIKHSLIKSDRWTTKKKEFQIRVKKHLTSNPFDVPMDKAIFRQLVKETTDLEKTINNLIEEKSELEDIITKLKEAKDKTAVAEILKKKKTNRYEEFNELCGKVTKLLDKQSGIMNGLIFRSYSGKDIKIGWDANRDELDEAHANDYINEDLDIQWSTTKEMQKINDALDSVSTFINSDLDNNFHEAYEEEFDSPLEIKNKGFWEEVFEAKIRFN
ncbi:toll/interleukin-1 receptor domain-containing protein [Flavobacterium sp. GT3R68]|uniref:toll/interleukin-1 receptor domain-containing protein n=1 Tax=Flavobacterium sp. GT3R68 TaxID=2594437 RepID=UPI000F89C803|nr:toll/interleukin-1 receptor domain-containing protein [Flavobacterium sp. GT3R68]RTY89639.1 toll/interleukin-1 receptor domain-containing protein [Flavobacterium sp. GSN2]TRW89474.1 toll/interleukin-1 receptor domain-containing protein [Flavobacterium sp. GT3R68]